MTDALNLPALRLPSGVSAEQHQFNRAVLAYIQQREGQQGNDLEKVLTRRDLQDLGLTSQAIQVLRQQNVNGGGAYSPLNSLSAQGLNALADKLRATAVFRALMSPTSDASRFEQLDADIRETLSKSIAEEAAARGTAVQQVQEIVQGESRARAQLSTELTAKLRGALSGLRVLQAVTATAGRATAQQVTQLEARLDDFDGGGASVEEVLLAVADAITGLLAQWTIKVTAGGAFAGIGVAAEDPIDGAADSYIIMVANQFAFVKPTDVIGTGVGQVNPRNPGASRIPFGIDSDGVIYLNGQVRINANGAPLLTLAKELDVTAPTQVFKQNAAGTWDATTITLTGTKINGLTGTPAWTVISGTYTGSLTAGNTLTVTRANMTSDTVTFRGTVTDAGVAYTDDITVVKLVDGSNTITAFLSNESHTVPANSVGNVTSFAGCVGNMRVFNGTTDVSALATYAVVTNPNGIGISINAAGVYTCTAEGSWAAGTPVTTATLRAVYNGVSLDKIFTITKAMTGASGAAGSNGSAGSNGVRGSIMGYGAIGDAPAWQDTHAQNVVVAMTGSAVKVPGDTVTLSYSNTWSETRYWTGAAWVLPGVVIDGNLLVHGTVTTDALFVNAATVAAASAISTGFGPYPLGAGTTFQEWNSLGLTLTTTGSRTKWLGSLVIRWFPTHTNISGYTVRVRYNLDGTFISEDVIVVSTAGGTTPWQVMLPIFCAHTPAAGAHSFGISLRVEFGAVTNGTGGFDITGKLLVEENKV